MRVFRLLRILLVAWRYGLDEFLIGPESTGLLRPVARTVRFFRGELTSTRAIRLRLALQDLGPIFVKFGQVLSTRRDLLPTDLADELAKLQDRVPPFPSEQVVAKLEQVFGRPVEEVFTRFDREPVASASVAQVHFAEIPATAHASTTTPRSSRVREPRAPDSPAATVPVAVKVLRPNISGVIAHDVALMYTGAALMERVWSEARRLRPREVVAEFERTLVDELDLTREAANCSQLHRNFDLSPLLRVPTVYWDYCSTDVMVMERMDGTPISQVDALREKGVDIPTLARAGVEIFFTQVFRDGFFHADMHPGNIFVATEGPDRGKYIAVDFGIMGTLSERDKSYLAQNFVAFFRRDYHRVATAHIESGWVPPDTRPDALEAEIRVVCEPIFGRPLKEISLGKVLMQLFKASRRFNVEIQPQLVLLQKTLLNVEGLGRQLDPDLDLWITARPYLERWMQDQIGLPGLQRRFLVEAPYIATALPQLPRLMHQALTRGAAEPDPTEAIRLELERTRNRWLAVLVLLVAATLAVGIALLLRIGNG